MLHAAIRTPHPTLTIPLRRLRSVPCERMLLRSGGTPHSLLTFLLLAVVASPHLIAFTSSFCVHSTALEKSLSGQVSYKGTCSSKFPSKCARQGTRLRPAPRTLDLECSVTLHDGEDRDDTFTSFPAVSAQRADVCFGMASVRSCNMQRSVCLLRSEIALAHHETLRRMAVSRKPLPLKTNRRGSSDLHVEVSVLFVCVSGILLLALY